MSNRDCPPLGEISEHPEHVRACARCAALSAQLPKLGDTDLPETGTAQSGEAPPRGAPLVGEVWSIRSPGRPGLQLGLLTRLEDEQVEVLAVADSHQWALASDCVLPAEVLGFPAMVQSQIGGTVLLEQLDERIGLLRPRLWEELQRGPLNASAWGPRSLSERDPRYGFQARCADDWTLTFEPAELLAKTVSLGRLVTFARQRRGLDTTALAERVDRPKEDLETLEADAGRLSARWPPMALASVLSALEVIWSRQLATRIQKAVALTARDTPATAALGFRGARSATSDTEAYVTAVHMGMARPPAAPES